MNSKFITEEAMEQYKEVKRMRACNMFDYDCVVKAAGQLGFHDLASLSMEEYGQLLMNAEERRERATKLLIERSICHRKNEVKNAWSKLL